MRISMLVAAVGLVACAPAARPDTTPAPTPQPVVTPVAPAGSPEAPPPTASDPSAQAPDGAPEEAEPAPASGVHNVPVAELESRRISGNKNLIPDDATKLDIRRAGRTRVVVPVQLCLDEHGQPSRVRLLKSSGFPAYDAVIEAGMRTWRYRPHEVEGRPAPVCTAVVFIYKQPAANDEDQAEADPAPKKR